MGLARALIGVGFVLVASGTGCASTSARESSRSPRYARAIVDHVVDGDTVDVRLDGHATTVRILQIDAPESSSTRYGRPDRCGARATAFAHTLTRADATVTLQYAGSDRADRYGRRLALVHLGGAHAATWEARMVRAGWAEVYVFEGNTTPLLRALRADARFARTRRLGVWRFCGGHFHDSGDDGAR